MITSNTVLEAVWDTNTYKVTFKNSDGTEYAKKDVLYNGKVEKPEDTPTPNEGYTFKHWATSAGSETEYDFNTPITSDITLSAVCEKLQVFVSFYDGNRLLSSGYYNWGEDIEFPTFSDVGTGCTITKWILGEDEYYSDPTFNLSYRDEEYSFVAFITTDLITINNGSISATDNLKNSTTITALNIPHSINGKIVTAIGDKAFQDCSSLTSITVPESVTSIGNSAFEGCTSLSSINIPSNINSIGYYAFQNCSSLESIKIPASCTTIKSYAFYQCKSLQTADIAEGCTSIGDWAFRECEKLESIVVPSSVTSLGNWVIAQCPSLRSADIKANVKELDKNIFNGDEKLETICLSSKISSLNPNMFVNTPSLQTIEVHAGNANFLSIDGVLYDKNKTKLICYPAAKQGDKPDASFTIPDTVTTIGGFAFTHIQNLKSIIIPNTVTAIEQLAFYSCKNRIDVYINQDESDLFKDAFDGDSKAKVTIHWNSTGPESQN